jgi:hypothetical protein
MQAKRNHVAKASEPMRFDMLESGFVDEKLLRANAAFPVEAPDKITETDDWQGGRKGEYPFRDPSEIFRVLTRNE